MLSYSKSILSTQSDLSVTSKIRVMSPSGFLLIDKPSGWTSHDVVAKVRSVIGLKKVGHGGTLDPLATGLLVVGLGQATKQLEQFVQGDKTYLATVRLGHTSTTDDGEGELTEGTGSPPELDAVREVLDGLRGEQDQLPPIYSALKTAGRKHYELARAGREVERRTRPVTVHDIELIAYDWPDLAFRAAVSKGTYIRSMARDLGEHLKTGGYLLNLRRERVGVLSVDDAIPIDSLDKRWRSSLLPV